VRVAARCRENSTVPRRFSVQRRILPSPFIQGVGAFHDPPFPGLDGGGDGFAGDLVDVAEFVEQVPGAGGVIAAVQVHTRPVGQRSDHVRDLAHGGFEQG